MSWLYAAGSLGVAVVLAGDGITIREPADVLTAITAPGAVAVVPMVRPATCTVPALDVASTKGEGRRSKFFMVSPFHSYKKPLNVVVSEEKLISASKTAHFF